MIDDDDDDDGECLFWISLLGALVGETRRKQRISMTDRLLFVL